MMRNIRPIHTRLLTAIMAGVASTGLATAAMAKGSGAGVNANASAGIQAASPGYVQAGGAADAHLNAYVSTNTHAQWQSGATLSADRADMNSNGPTPSATAEAAGQATTQAKYPGPR